MAEKQRIEKRLKELNQLIHLSTGALCFDYMLEQDRLIKQLNELTYENK